MAPTAFTQEVLSNLVDSGLFGYLTDGQVASFLRSGHFDIWESGIRKLVAKQTANEKNGEDGPGRQEPANVNPLSIRESFQPVIVNDRPAREIFRPDIIDDQFSMTLKFHDDALRDVYEDAEPDAIKLYLNRQLSKAPLIYDDIQVQSICRFRSGDLHICANSEFDKQLLLEKNQWAQNFGRKARVFAPRYQILFPQVNKRCISHYGGSLMDGIASENPGVFQGAQIVHWEWSFPPAPDSQHGSIVLVFSSAGAVSRAIQQGLSVAGEHWTGELEDSDCKPTQCTRCWNFGHAGTICIADEIICGKCAATGHTARDCGGLNPVRCAICEKKHPAWSKKCKKSAAKRLRLKRFRKNRPPVDQ